MKRGDAGQDCRTMATKIGTAKKGRYVMKSSERDKIEGALYKVGGRVLQAIGSLSGDRKKKIKGRLGRGKGTVKDRESRLKGFFK
jgi:uncharacterized protein YjbJ (UPF0337 family)